MVSQLPPGCFPGGLGQGPRAPGDGSGSGPTAAASLFGSRGLLLAVFGIPGNPGFGGDLLARGDLRCCCCRRRRVTEAGTGGSSSSAKGSELDPGCPLDTSEARMVESRLFLRGALGLSSPGDEGRSQGERTGSGDPPAEPPSWHEGTSTSSPECQLGAAPSGVLCFRTLVRDVRLVTEENLSSSEELNSGSCQNKAQRSASKKVTASGALGPAPSPTGHIPEVQPP